jgi:nudix-type nucleoside diphosphatase (YffH/AdpP family)
VTAADLKSRIAIKEVQTLADDWSVLKKTTLDFQRVDGSWQTLTRETYDRGNGAAILLYNRDRRTVILTKQFRYPAFVNGYSELMIEVCAGLLDENDAETCIKLEAEEETGYRVTDVKKIWEVYMSPGSVTEKLYFFIGEYHDALKVSDGGGLAEDGEDIDVIEIDISQSLSMIDSGKINDAKTIMLLQYVALKNLFGPDR